MNRVIIISIFLFLGLQFKCFSQHSKSNTVIPSDAPTGYTYDFNKAQALIISRLSKPDLSNQEAEIIISEPTFPKLKKDEKTDDAYKERLRIWIEKNPNLIISAFKNRKEIVQPY